MNQAPTTFCNVPMRAWKALWPLGIVTGMTILLAMGVYSLTLLPSENTLRALHIAHQQERKLFGELREQRKTQKEFVQLRTKLQQAWNVLPAQKEFASMALTISQLANTEHVFIPGMSYSQSQTSNGLPPKASLTFSASGTYPSIYRFIYHLEQSQQYLFIEHLNVTRANTSHESKTGRVRFNMKVSTFLKQDLLEETTL